MQSLVTTRQKDLLSIIYKYIKDTGYPPTFEEMRIRLKVKSNQSVIDLLHMLETKKIIKKGQSGARTIAILPYGYEIINEQPLVPFLGVSHAGFAIPTNEMTGEWQQMSRNIAKFGSDVFLLRISGDSMINAGIDDGDMVLIKNQKEFISGDIVLADIDGESTIKRFISDNNPPYVYLKPENPKYQLVPATDNMRLKGKVISIIKNKKIVQPISINNDLNLNIVNAVSQKPYFLKDNFALYLGDCLEVMKQFPDDHFDMIFADPPYNLSNGGFTVHAGRRVSVNKGEWDKSNGLKKDFEFNLAWIQACRRVLKPGGTIWISGTYHSIYKCGFALQVAKFHILNDISWFKPNASPNLSCRFFTASHETLIWARKDKNAKHIFNYNLMKNGNWPEDQLKKPGLQMRSVWAMGTPKPEEKIFGKHPTQKPLELLRRIILASTNKDDVILDPFTGSSTTGLAAYKHGRKFIGIDTEKQYLDLSIKRLEELDRNLKNKFQF